ncbi:rod shape-determining protein MreC [Mucilaginibacter robiniae]|uniref:Cell shape-determining protein MreC n=1 Tax=Mucilaginibacter robiniae TaxID=2728022 RepID=A0A7L5DW11_9SPHI|nr:rod shape-determining protein MreC [Mucilaginibacter robiniae]QJD94931.1 rod shape-determining protein MreC [Mucilaginibacter robiniae]
MRNLLIFISKYNAFFLFLIFEISALIIYVKYNTFQKATFINTTNQITGNLDAQVNRLTGYLSLQKVNDSLARENARLYNQLKSSYYVDTSTKKAVIDTIYKQQYTYIEARVINNSVNKRNNYITIQKGSEDGISKGMGVMSSAGVVGLVVYTTPHLSLVQSLLHKDTKVSAMLAGMQDIGTIIWGNDMNPHKGLLIDIPNNVKPRIGQAVVTSNYSTLFPAGIQVGKISNLHARGGGFFLNMEVALSVDFSKLQYVYVVNNKFATEQAGMEAQEKKDD